MEVRLPNGQIAKFPDTMPRGEIRAFIGSKFPDSGLEYDPNDLLRAQIRLQNTKMEMSRPQPQVENNPYASSLPGPLGQFQDMSSAFQRGAMEGMTGNLSDEIFAGAVSPFDAVGRAAQGDGFDLGRSFNDLYAGSSDMRQGQSALNPDAAGAGNITGALVLGSRLGGLSPVGRATTPLGMGALGAAEGAAYGALYGIGGAEGNIGERAIQAAPEIGLGALAGGGLGYTVGALGPRISEEARTLNRGLTADQIDPSTIQARLRAIDPSVGVIADLGPNLQGQAAALATLPGPGSRIVSDALTSRRAGANARIRSEVAEALGPAPRPSQVAQEIEAGKDALDPVYRQVLQQKAASENPALDATPLVRSIDDIASNYVGGTRRAIERARDLLVDPQTGIPTTNPGTILAARRELDGLIGAETNTTTQAALVEARKMMDDSLAANVPGLKEVDAKFQDLARQQEANTRGTTVLRDGVTQSSPDDLAEEMVSMFLPSGVNVGPTNANARRLEQGLISDINRVIGQSANDRVKLRNLIRGEGSWNYDNVALVLGRDKADDLMRILNKEARMAETENLATSGSRTQVLKAGQEDFAIKPNPSIMREALNFQYGNAAARVADAILGGSIAARREGVNANVARALMAQEISPQMQKEISRLTFGLPQTSSIGPNGEMVLGRDAIAAALAAQGANRSNDRKPLRIVVQGAGSYEGR